MQYQWDSVWYETKEEFNAVKKLYGSIRPYRIRGMQRFYTLLEADAANLPTHNAVGGGSCAIAVDTLTIYLYDAVNKTWHAHAQES